jgi:predicted acyl esterase
LHAGTKTLTAAPPSSDTTESYPALSPGVAFTTGPLAEPLEFAGPIKAHLFVSCSKPDMDLFATLTAHGPDGTEHTFFSATEPASPVTQGWLRVTQRKTDPARSTEWLPLHTHDERQPLTPGEIYEIDLEIWPGSIALPAGHRLDLVLQGKDFERDTAGEFKGSGFFLHNDPVDRPPERYDGEHTIHTGPERQAYLLLPVTG